MGRPAKILPTPDTMGLVASRKLREPVMGIRKNSFNKLNLRSEHWERLYARQKLTVANIAIHYSTTAYFFTLKLHR